MRGPVLLPRSPRTFASAPAMGVLVVLLIFSRSMTSVIRARSSGPSGTASRESQDFFLATNVRNATGTPSGSDSLTRRVSTFLATAMRVVPSRGMSMLPDVSSTSSTATPPPMGTGAPSGATTWIRPGGYSTRDVSNESE